MRTRSQLNWMSFGMLLASIVFFSFGFKNVSLTEGETCYQPTYIHNGVEYLTQDDFGNDVIYILNSKEDLETFDFGEKDQELAYNAFVKGKEKKCGTCLPTTIKGKSAIASAKKYYPKSGLFFQEGYVYIACTPSKSCLKNGCGCTVRGWYYNEKKEKTDYVAPKGQKFDTESRQKKYKNKTWHKVPLKVYEKGSIKCYCDKKS